MSDTELDAAYRAAPYWFVPPTGEQVTIRCGQRCEPLDRLLAAAGVEHWAFVTACNPRSRRLAAAANRARMARLGTVVRDRGFQSWPATGGDDSAVWPPEPSLLVLGMTEAEAVALGRAFEQNAILVGSRGTPSRLVWVDSPPPG
jgi:hypothetical protein